MAPRAYKSRLALRSVTVVEPGPVSGGVRFLAGWERVRRPGLLCPPQADAQSGRSFNSSARAAGSAERRSAGLLRRDGRVADFFPRAL
jgi:hypothetical protein